MNTPFFGRSAELNELALATDEKACAVICGYAGMGKSSLAKAWLAHTEDARDTRERFFVSLQDCSSAEDVFRATCMALKAPVSASSEHVVKLVSQRKNCRIVFDNAEGCESAIVALLTAMRSSQCEFAACVTSRTELKGLDAEVLYLRSLDEASALTLASDCVARLRQNTKLSSDKARKLVSLTGAHPLAIELSIASLTLQTIDELISELEGKTRFLSEPKTASQAIEVLASSMFHLLPQTEKNILLRLAYLRGRFMRYAAVAVCDCTPTEFDAAFMSLIRNEWVRVSETSQDVKQFYILPPLRRYLFSLLEKSEFYEDTIARHRDYFVSLFAKASSQDKSFLRSEGQSELENAWVAVDQSSPETQVKALSAVAPFALVHADFASIERHVEAMLKTKQSPLDVLILNTIGATCEIHTGKVVALLKRLGPIDFSSNRPLHARAELMQAQAAWLMGAEDISVSHSQKAIELFVGVDDMSRALALCYHALVTGQESLVDEALACARQSEDSEIKGTLWAHAAIFYLYLGDPVRAESLARQAVEIAARTGDRQRQGLWGQMWGPALYLCGRYAEAFEVLSQISLQTQRAGATTMAVRAACAGAIALHAMGRLDEALKWFQMGIELMFGSQDPFLEARALAFAAPLYAEKGDFSQALALINRGEEKSRALGGKEHIPFYKMVKEYVEALQKGLVTSIDVDSYFENLNFRSTVTYQLQHLIRVRQSVLLQKQVAAHSATPTEQVEQLVLSADGSWFELNGQKNQNLAKYKPLRQILVALANARIQSPGVAIGVNDLVDAGWPGENTYGESGLNRLRNAVARLRALGLQKVIVTQSDGYLVSLSAACQLVDDVARLCRQDAAMRPS